MNRNLRIAAIVLGVVVVVLVVLPFLIPVNQFRGTVEEKLSAALGRKTQVGNLSLSLISGSLGAEDLSIADDPKFSRSPFLTAKSLKVGVEIFPLIFSRALHVTSLTIDKPEVLLLRDAAGRWNFSSLSAHKSSDPESESAASDLSVGKLALKDGRITVGTVGSSKRSVYDRVSVAASDVSYTSEFPVKITASLPGGGSLKLDGRAGPVDEKDAALSPLNATITIDSLDLARTGFVDSSAGLGGLLDLNATLASKNGEARTKGTLKLSKLQLVAGGAPSTVPAAVDFSSNYDLRKNAGVVNPSAIKIGSAVAHLAGTYQTPAEETSLNLKLEGKDLPARDLEAFLPALGVNLPKGASLAAGTLNADLTVQGPTNKLITTGSVGLYAAKLAGFNLGSKLSAISALAGIKTGSDLDIQQLTTNVHVAPDGIRSENFNAVVPALGTLVGNGTIDAKNALDFKMIATLASGAVASGSGTGAAGGALGSLLGNLGGRGGSGKSGGLTIPFLIQGTASDPKFIPDVKGLATSLLKSQLANAAAPSKSNANSPNENPLEGITSLFKKKKP